MRNRCGAPTKTRDPKRPWGTCRKFVAIEGNRCHLHVSEPALPAYADEVAKRVFG